MRFKAKVHKMKIDANRKTIILAPSKLDPEDY